MDIKLTRTSILASASTVIALAASPAFAWQNCYGVNLKNGTSSPWPLPAGIEFFSAPTLGSGGYYQTVFKVNLHPNGGPVYTSARFTPKYDAVPTGVSVNIGDSPSNNGNGGDSSPAQSNDAEIQIGTYGQNPERPDELQVWAHDGWPYYFTQGNSLMADVYGFASAGTSYVNLTVSDQTIKYTNPVGAAGPIGGTITSSWLYALNGQADSQGPVNYDVYAAFNRVIDLNTVRSGTGVAAVTVCLFPQQ